MKSIILLVLTLASLNFLSACSATNGSTSSGSGVSNVPRGLTPIQSSGMSSGSRLSAPINTYQ